jgi:hypothetical protein
VAVDTDPSGADPPRDGEAALLVREPHRPAQAVVRVVCGEIPNRWIAHAVAADLGCTVRRLDPVEATEASGELDALTGVSRKLPQTTLDAARGGRPHDKLQICVRTIRTIRRTLPRRRVGQGSADCADFADAGWTSHLGDDGRPGPRTSGASTRRR